MPKIILDNAVDVFNDLKQRLDLTDEEQANFKRIKTTEYKLCCKCHNYKPLDKFYPNVLKRQGVFDYCKECAKKMERINRKEVKRINYVSDV